MDRIDIHVEVPRVEYEKLTGKSELETSAQVRRRTLAARERQARRFAGHTRVRVNAEMGPAEVRAFCEAEGGCGVRGCDAPHSISPCPWRSPAAAAYYVMKRPDPIAGTARECLAGTQGDGQVDLPHSIWWPRSMPMEIGMVRDLWSA
jgi:hypothetical protein